MERYIIRSEESMSKPIELDMFSPELLILFMKEFYKFKDIIDYNSWIYIITTEYENKCIPILNGKQITYTYEIHDTIAKRYIDATTSGSSDYKSSNSTITIPRVVLLFDKNNQCRYVELSTKLLESLYKRASNTNFVNIGHLIFAIDASYNSCLNQICSHSESTSYKVPLELLPFISKNIPHLNNYNRFGNNPPRHLSNFINENLSIIKEDLLIEDEKREYKHYEYIKMDKLLSAEKARRKAQLLEELRMLESD